MMRQSLWVILCHLPEKGRKEIKEIVEGMKERDWKERGTGMFVCVEVLRPSQPSGVMSSAVSLPNHVYWAGLVL